MGAFSFDYGEPDRKCVNMLRPEAPKCPFCNVIYILKVCIWLSKGRGMNKIHMLLFSEYM